MLEWHHDRRASARQMLDHPWLNLAANYETRYTEKEYQIQPLKKDLKKEDWGPHIDNTREEMNELIDSDPELYEPDVEDENLSPIEKKKRPRKMNGAYNDQQQEEKQLADKLDQLYEDSDDSLEERPAFDAKKKARQKQEAKINNSFTGPYPIDPTEFNHNDKGANAQFQHFYQEL